MGDHDSLFKLGFGDPLHAAGELRSVLPPAIVEAVELDRLERVPGSFVDEDLAQRHTDLLFRAPRRDTGEPLYLYFLIEHQSEPDRWKPLRVLGYVLRIWEALTRTEAPRHLPPSTSLRYSTCAWSPAPSCSTPSAGTSSTSPRPRRPS